MSSAKAKNPDRCTEFDVMALAGGDRQRSGLAIAVGKTSKEQRLAPESAQMKKAQEKARAVEGEQRLPPAVAFPAFQRLTGCQQSRGAVR